MHSSPRKNNIFSPGAKGLAIISCYTWCFAGRPTCLEGKNNTIQNKEVTMQSHRAELKPGWWSLPLNWAANWVGPGKSFKVWTFLISGALIHLRQMLQLEAFFYLIGPLTHCHSHQVDYLHKNNWTNCWNSGLLFGFWFFWTDLSWARLDPPMKKIYINMGSS